MNNVMIDIETLATTPNAAILSVGAVFFDVNGNLGAEFEMAVNMRSAIEKRFVCKNTLAWWKKQPEEARSKAFYGHASMEKMLVDLYQFIAQGGSEVRVWGNGPTFDITILEHAFDQYGYRCPWKFFNVRCCRTVEDLSMLNRGDFEREGTHHSALDDAKYQAKYISAMIRNLTH